MTTWCRWSTPATGAATAATTPRRCRRWRFATARPSIGHEVRDLEPGGAAATCPAGIDGTAYQWVDLDGEGLSGILARQRRCLVLQAQPRRWPVRADAHARHRSPPSLGQARGRQLLDLAGDGHLDLVDSAARSRLLRADRRPRAGEPFRPFHVAAEHRLGRPGPALCRSGRRRPRRRPDHRDDAFTWYRRCGRGLRRGASGRSPAARRGARAARSCSPTRRSPSTWPTCPATDCPTSCASATARSATGPISATAGSAPR